ncbi:SCO3242 family prenyltransferase [Microbacterium sp. gxy059]|uniref:SCO3242 family prenyltransferase n=1 Tax=Microbacterium sp. gxy059 TaxID=2957199 RepID=UPI003D987699
MALRDVLELVRAPAILTVIGDGIAGAASAGPLSARTAAASTASAALYAAGMALNDVVDADLDAVERPERPIPSGRISRGRALGIATGLTAAGVAVAGSAGPRARRIALPLAGCVWLYDLVAKRGRLGPVAMAACRGLDVLMGAASSPRAALLPAGAIAAHTMAVTQVSRGEVHGTSRAASVAAAALSVAASGAAIAAAREHRGRRAGAAIGAAAFLATVLPGFVRAARDPSARHARDATRQGIRGMVPLQAAFAAAGGSGRGAMILAAVDAIGRLLAAKRRQGDVT